MMNKYTVLQKIGIYSSIALFLTFMLLPFVEMFIASLRPLTHLFSRPDVAVGETMSFMDFMSRFWSDKMSFQARLIEICGSLFLNYLVISLTVYSYQLPLRFLQCVLLSLQPMHMLVSTFVERQLA